MAENTENNGENSKTQDIAVTVRVSDVLTKLHKVALENVKSSFPGIQFENLAFDDSSQKFKGPGKYLLMATKANKDDLLPKKTEFLEALRTYIEYFVGGDAPKMITDKNLVELYNPEEQAKGQPKDSKDQNAGNGEGQAQGQQNAQGNQENPGQITTESICDQIAEAVLSPSYTGIFGYGINYSVNIHGRGSSKLEDSFKGRTDSLFGGMLADLRNLTVKVPGGETFQVGKLLDPDEWKKALGIPDIDANNIDSDIKRILNHVYPNNTAQVGVFKANAVNNMLSKQHYLTTEIQKFVSQAELSVVIKVYHSDHNYPDYTTKSMADIFNRAAGAYYKNFRLTNRDYISEKHVLLVRNATDSVADKPELKRSYGTPVSGRQNPRSGTGTSESVFVITSSILESLFGDGLVHEDDAETEEREVQAPENAGGENKEPNQNYEEMIKFAGEKLRERAADELKDRQTETSFVPADQCIERLKELGLKDQDTEKWLTDNGAKAYMNRAFAIVDFGPKGETVSESLISEEDKTADQTKRIDRLSRYLSSPESATILGMLKDDSSFTNNMAAKFTAAEGESGSTAKDKLINFLSKDDSSTTVKTAFRNLDPVSIELLTSRFDEFQKRASEESRMNRLEEIFKSINLTGNSTENSKIEDSIKKNIKEEDDRREAFEKVLKSTALDVKTKFNVEEDNDRFIFRQAKIRKTTEESKPEETISESILSLLFESAPSIPTDKLININGALIKRALDLADAGCKSQKSMRNLNPIYNLFAYAPRDRVIQYLTTHGFCSDSDFDDLTTENLFVCIVKRGDGEHNGSFGEPAFTDDSVKKMFELSLENNLEGFKILPEFKPTLNQIKPRNGELFTKSLGFNSVKYPFKALGKNSPVNEADDEYPIPVLNAWVASGNPPAPSSGVQPPPGPGPGPGPGPTPPNPPPGPGPTPPPPPGVDPFLYLYILYWIRGNDTVGTVGNDADSDLYIIPRKNLTFKNDREITKDVKDGNYSSIHPNSTPYTK